MRNSIMKGGKTKVRCRLVSVIREKLNETKRGREVITEIEKYFRTFYGRLWILRVRA